MKFKELFNENGLPDWKRIEEIGEFAALIGNEQSSVWHKEGDVWNHTVLVTNAMVSLLTLEGITPGSRDFIVLVSAAICHDIGKPPTREWDKKKNDWTSPNHGHVGARMVRNLFFDEDVRLREEVCFLVDTHMICHHLLEKKDEVKHLMTRKLNMGLRPFKDLVLLNYCDNLGSENDMMSKDDIMRRVVELLNLIEDTDKVQTRTISELALLQGIEPDKIKRCEPKTYVFVLIGLPGAGKNYYLDTHITDNESVGILSRDDIRTEIGIKGEKPQGTKEQEEEVTRIFENRLREYAETKTTIFINNVNVKKKYRDRYIEILSKYTNGTITYIYFNTDVDTCLKRRYGMIPWSVIQRMNNNFDFPQLCECNALYVTDGKSMEKLIQNG